MNANQEISHGAPSNVGRQPSGARTDETVVRHFIKEAGVIGNYEPVMSTVEMDAFVHGPLNS